MKLTIAITDACIFIDLFDLDLISSFFNLELEIHTSIGVFYEINEQQQQEVLKKYQADGKLIIHNLQEDDFIKIHSENYPISLSEAEIINFPLVLLEMEIAWTKQ